MSGVSVLIYSADVSGRVLKKCLMWRRERSKREEGLSEIGDMKMGETFGWIQSEFSNANESEIPA